LETGIIKGILILALLSFSGLYAQPNDATATDSIPTRNPRHALYFSLIPGAGQLYNHEYLKAVLFSSVFTVYAFRYRDAAIEYDQTSLTSDHRTRNDQAWMMGLTWTLGLIDAYVDAQLYNFDRYTVEGATPGDSLILGKEMKRGR